MLFLQLCNIPIIENSVARENTKNKAAHGIPEKFYRILSTVTYLI